MAIFEIGAQPLTLTISGEQWRVVVVDLYNPTEQEVTANKAHNDQLGDWEPELERPTGPMVKVAVRSKDDEEVEMYWDPTHKVLLQHVSRRGWSRSHFNRIKGELLRWKLPDPEQGSSG